MRKVRPGDLFRDMSLRKKMTLSFVAILCVPIFALGFFSYNTAKKDLNGQVMNAMESNVLQIATDLEGRFRREGDFTRFIAYNFEFRKLLEFHPFNHVAIAKEMNDRWEPTLWYFLTSDSNIKTVRIYTKSVSGKVGSFLFPASKAEEEPWYQYHQKNFETRWWREDGKLYATRTILGAGPDMRESLGVIYVEFHPDTLFEPLLNNSYMKNGFLLTDENQKVIFSRTVENPQVNRAAEQIAAGGASPPNSRCMASTAVIESAGWKLTYYIDREETSGRLSQILGTSVLAAGICFALALFLIGLLAKTLSARILLLRDAAREIAQGNLTQEICTDAKDEIGVVTNSIGKMSRRLNDLINRVYRVELEKRAAELKALQAMINPHFLYNCLSSIKWKALESGADDIGEIAGLVAKFYRTSLNNGKLLTTVENEVENIRAYIGLLRLTHENSFDVEYDLEEGCLTLQMLNFLLQPIVENAFKHGIDQKEDGERGWLRLEVAGEGEWLWFRIYNNGPPILDRTIETLLSGQSAGYGVRNIQERIALYYGEGCGLGMFVDASGHTCFTVKLCKHPSEVPH